MPDNTPTDVMAALPVHLPRAARRDIGMLKANWGWFLALGLLLIVAGAAAVGLTFLSTILTVVAIGAFALVAAGIEAGAAFWSRGWEGALLHVLTAVLYGVFGFLLLTRPVVGAEVLTLLLAVVLLVNGVARVAFAATVRFHHWGWAVASGLVSALLGVLIWQDLPESGLWVIGLFVGIDLLATGWTWVMLGLALRNLPGPGAAG